MNAQLQTIQFHNQSLVTFAQNGVRYTAMKPICDNIGLEWGSQYNRIKRDEVLAQGAVMISMPSQGGEQQTLCLPIQYLNGWLFGIDTKRVKPEIRETLITYKKECYQALHDYWHNKAEKAQPQALSAEHQQLIKDMVLNRAKQLPKAQQAKGAIMQWSALKSHFGKSYKEIDDSQFLEAVSLLARLPLEGELLTPAAGDCHCILSSEELDHLLWLWFEAYQMNQFIGSLVKPLEALQSKHAPKAYSQHVEYRWQIKHSAKIIQKLIEGVELGANPLPRRQLEQLLQAETALVAKPKRLIRR